MLYIVQLNLNIIEGDLQRAKNKMHAKISTHVSLCVYDSKFELCKRGVLLFILNLLL